MALTPGSPDYTRGHVPIVIRIPTPNSSEADPGARPQKQHRYLTFLAGQILSPAFVISPIRLAIKLNKGLIRSAFAIYHAARASSLWVLSAIPSGIP